jgi:hypothetical protein
LEELGKTVPEILSDEKEKERKECCQENEEEELL